MLVPDLPDVIDELADELISSRGAEAVVVGGSRAIGRHGPGSDWDVGLYYRGDVDLSALAMRGEVHPPGTWGRVMNGGAWLDLGGLRVDVLLRDLAVVERWTSEASLGRFEVDGLLGYLAGIPTYSLTAEASIALVLRGGFELSTGYPAELVAAGPPHWRARRDFTLLHADKHASRGNVVGAIGQCARAVLEEAHARCCEQARWVLNEQHLLDAAGLSELDRHFGVLVPGEADLAAIVAEVSRWLDDRTTPGATGPGPAGPPAGPWAGRS